MKSDLVAKRAKAMDELKALVEKPELTADEEKRADALEAEVQKYDTKIARLERANELALRGESHATDDPDEEDADKGETESRAVKPPDTEKRGVRVEVQNKKDENPFRSFGENLQAIARISKFDLDTRTREQLVNKIEICHRAALGQNISVNTEGGFAIHPEFAAGIQKRAFEVGAISSRVNWIPLTVGNQLIITALKDDKRTTGNRNGGVRIYMGNEAEAATKSKMDKLRQISTDLKKMIGLYYATEEILEDAPALGALIDTAFSDEVAFSLDDQILRGDGNQQLKGLLGSAVEVTISKETGQAAASIVYQNVIKMYARSTGGAGLMWIGNRDILPTLTQMNLAVGTGGIPVWMPANGAVGAPHNTLFGLPLEFVEHCETAGTKGDLILLDLNRYLGVKKGGLKTDSSIHVQFLTGESTFRIMMRVGGQPWDDAPITPYKGTATLSPFVTLQTRA